MRIRTQSEQKAYLDGFERCAECVKQYLSDKGKNILEYHLMAVRNAVETEDVEPREKIGHWVGIEYDGYADGNPVYDTWECSECGWEHNGTDDTLTCFCPNCGARMEDKE